MELRTIIVENDEIPILFFRCSKCKQHINSSDMFCRKCGHKLERVKTTLTIEEVCDIITAALKGNQIPSNVSTESAEGTEDKSGIPSNSDENNPWGTSDKEDFGTTSGGGCPRCKESATGCEFLEDGICKGICHPTYPPQYPDCVFLKRTNI